MVWGAVALFCILVGFWEEDTIAILIGVVIAIFGTRRTVFDFNKIGAFVNISVLLVAGVLGGIIYFSDDENKSSPQETVKKYIPKVAQQKQEQPPIKKPAQKILSSAELSENERKYENDLVKKLTSTANCSKQEDLNNFVLKKGDPTFINLKLCPDFKKIKLYFDQELDVVPSIYDMTKNHGSANLSSFDFLKIDYGRDSNGSFYSFAPTGKKFEGYIAVHMRNYNYQ